jgi:CHAD domain-containing protein
MKTKHDQTTCAYGAEVLSHHVRAFRKEIGGALEMEDIEPIHQLRVYSRRIRAALPLFKPCFPKKAASDWEKQMKKITKTLAQARDLDVQIEYLDQFEKEMPEQKFHAGIRRLRMRLQQRRNKVQDKVTRALGKLSESNMLAEMEAFLEPLQRGEDEQTTSISGGLYRLAEKTITKKLRNFLAYEDCIMHPDMVAELHKMRISAKHLRYTMEVFAPIYSSKLKAPLQTLKKTQDYLGVIHDCDVWSQFLPQFFEKERQRTIDYYGNAGPFNFLQPGLEYFQQDRRKARQDYYEKFVADWIAWKADDVWGELARSIQIPSLPRDAIIPVETAIGDQEGESECESD